MPIATLFTRRPLFAGLTLLAALSLQLASCGPDTAAEPTFGSTELYPLRVGTYRIFAVVDTVWRENRPTIRAYEQREVVADSFPGPANSLGQPSLSYRVVRARRATAAQAWVEDSVLVLTPLPQALLLSQGNRRTLELLFPVRAGRVWNRLAFDAPDSLSREYRRLGEAVTLALPAGPPQTYERTVRTTDADQGDLFFQRGYEQIYAPGVGPVQRRRRNLSTFTLEPDGRQIPNPNYFIEGSTHREVLLEMGRL
ncbi:hypothetical protein [uncultured Hymenobacter sp.]|uniref:hypothetical protein n=1 Tax=uncultured Hymenobacter sp. TaxID=170016 RepID=UPI0035CAA98F